MEMSGNEICLLNILQGEIDFAPNFVFDQLDGGKLRDLTTTKLHVMDLKIFWAIGNSQQTKQPKININRSVLVNKERLTTFSKRRICAFAYEKTNYRTKINI